METKHWQKFYKKNKVTKTPSSFAKFCFDKIPDGSKIIDVGCGNGRDQEYLSTKGMYVCGVDKAVNNTSYSDIDNIFDVVYSRFFLHAIPTKELPKFIKWAGSNKEVMFMAECRAVGDKPVIYTDHK